MSHWLLETLSDTREQALKQASHAQVHHELFRTPFSEDEAFIRRTGETLEMVVLDLVREGITDDEENARTMHSCAADAFRLFRILPQADNPIDASLFQLRSSALAVLDLMRHGSFVNHHGQNCLWTQRTGANEHGRPSLISGYD